MNGHLDPAEDASGLITPAQGESDSSLTDGIGLCLSGGGYRAMLFHVGAIWRLNEVGLLGRVDRISSVSGGSITAGWLACVLARYPSESGGLNRSAFRDVFVAGLRRLADQTIDVPSVLRGFMPWHNVGREIAAAYDRVLFRGATLQDLPDRPRFIFNSSNLQTGVLWRFSKPYMGDYKVGRVFNPRLPLSTAVAASSAFPPVLSPIDLELRPEDYQLDGHETHHRPPYNTRPVLADGGVYDNLGLEPVLKRYRTVLVSDGGAPFKEMSDPSRNWPGQLKRVLDCIDNQVRSLRKRDLIDSYVTGQRKGAYWGIATPLSRFPETAGLTYTDDSVAQLASISTRLARMKPQQQEALINWGYTACAAALASHHPEAAPAAALPFPSAR